MGYLLRIGIILLITTSFTHLTPLHAQNLELVWSDEFEGDTLDESKWSFQFGTGASEGLVGWGNNELQYYTDREENIFVADGKLHIIARKESFNNRNYTSARIRSIYQGDWKFGRFEIRAKLPEGQGIWPAIWMMPTDNAYGGWAASGEIDIMELVGHEPGVVHGTIHYGGSWPDNVSSGASFQLDSRKFSDDFHTFALEWREDQIRWFVDGVLYQIQRNWFTQGHDFPAPFDKRFHMLLNVAVGGNWPGSPDETTVFPQEMIIDYVRVYQDPDQQDLGVSLPVDFEDTNIPWDDVIVNFDGGNMEVIKNPHQNEANPSNYVGRMIKNGGEFWGGAWLPISEEFAFDEDNYTISMKVWSPRENVPVLMKIEQQNGTQDYEISVETTTSNEWEVLIWDMSGAGFEEKWDIITLIFDMAAGQIGDGGPDFTWYFDDIEIFTSEIPTSTEQHDDSVPETFKLKQNYPNPFNPTTNIQFELSEISEITLDVYDIMGRHVANLANGLYRSGQHIVRFDASDLASGLYIYRLHTGAYVQTKKMLLLK
ncbi:MAG: family 16 glycosylhydrolase [Balneolaceae bacterium]